MSIQILHNANDDTACLYCSTSDWAFGPIFESSTQAEAFLKWADQAVAQDLRRLDDAELRALHGQWFALLTNDRTDGSRVARFIRCCRNAIRCGYDPHDARWFARERVGSRQSVWLDWGV